MPSPKQVVVGALGLGLSVTGLSFLAAPPASAVGGVFISELHYDDSTPDDGGGVGEFVELTAPAGTDLTDWKVVLVNGNNSTPYRTDTLSGTVADQVDGWGTHVVAYPAASGGVLQNGSPDGVALVDAGGTVVEFVSYEGSMTANLGEPATSVQSVDTGVAETNATAGDQSLQRLVDGTWTGPATHSRGVPNGFGVTELAATDPDDLELYVDDAMDAVQLQATGGVPPYSWAVTAGALPAGVTLSPTGQLTGTPTQTGASTVTFTVTDDGEPAATDDVEVTITVVEAPELLSIAEIQGTDTATSPRVGDVVRTQGVVTAMYRDPAFASSSIDGMYVQTAGTGGTTDATPGASDAIFVFGANAMPAGVEIGDSVEVTGEVSEFSGTTEITPGTGDVVELDTPLDAVEPLEIAYPTTEEGREAQEGMLLAPTDTFTVSNVYNTNTFAEVGLATGDTPLRQPTDVADDDDAEALQEVKDDNFARAVALDDGTSINYMTNNAAKGQPLPWLTAADDGPKPVRVGAEATLHAPVILEFRNSTWKFQPTRPVFGGETDAVATFENTRADNLAPRDVGGRPEAGDVQRPQLLQHDR
ncbi:putative Ig domain-containing protein [Nocardioides sp. TF02-7]|uniref:putative Ig domain-containing protein n=1 Tax=Nocardioides sp. TF02-7 TaxID=2917724 RepID=UPI001F05C24F|nr:putative Ig domain-containing protein [Nocardioides sp. TF02-7]UMG92697.1 putative Ig domain-containing protein [Nocardioides sp. TF02-7]